MNRETRQGLWELARLHKFGRGTLLMVWPSLWAITMLGKELQLSLARFLYLSTWFFLGNVLVHGLVCTWNDICDVDFDRKVERCRNRPLPSGRVSLSTAWLFRGFQLLLSLALFWTTIVGLAPVHLIYPLLKRVTYRPQAWLGLAMNWGWVVAWVSIADKSDWLLVGIMLAGAAAWTIVYDTIYALQDKKDDLIANVKSTALLFDSYVKPVLSIFSVFFVSCLLRVGVRHAQGLPYFCAVGGVGVHLAWQLWTLDDESEGDCAAKFRANSDVGMLLWLGMVVDWASADSVQFALLQN
ncbi:UbiA prenyltransferase [Dacryopinax primogenitus]|uniref:UbiA prenyltransferase n=1 Tax=Dacryopinax primogenitus (strain DJM 731) TaxID=1858805 RepID=M5G3J0_DACPD|nr:UbiA prenyltransferase [Dacryopinax primogenitus]EJU00432.1 UbiA prenyltransferase [Dacryopinax primogenitus]